VRWSALPLLVALLAGCGAAVAGGGVGLGVPVADFRPDDRVVLRDMRTIQAVAASFERLYAVYPSSVGLWRQGERRWSDLFRAPAPDALRRVFQAAVDPLDQSLWLVEPTALLHLDPTTERWDRLPLPGTARGLGQDPSIPDGILVESSAGWYVQPRVGTLRRITPGPGLTRAPTLEDAYEAMPQLRSMAAIIAQGPGLRVGRLTSAAPDPATNGWLIGTDLRGLLRFDVAGITPTPLLEGIAGNLVGAIVAVPTGVWVASTDRSQTQPIALEFLDADLGHTRTIEGNPVFGLGVNRITRIVPDLRRLWLATDIGVLRVGLDDGAIARWNTGDGLTDDRVLSLAQWQGGVAVGMERGLAMIEASGAVSRPAVPVLDAVYDLQARGDTLWAATARGLRYMTAGDSALQPDRRAAIDPGSGIDLFAVRSLGDTLVTMNARRVLWRDPVTGSWSAGPDLTPQAGALRLMAVARGGIWVAGDRGAVLVRVGTGVLAALATGRDLPAPVTALAVDDRYLWVGTLDGLVRVRLSR